MKIVKKWKKLAKIEKMTKLIPVWAKIREQRRATLYQRVFTRSKPIYYRPHPLMAKYMEFLDLKP